MGLRTAFSTVVLRCEIGIADRVLWAAGVVVCRPSSSAFGRRRVCVGDTEAPRALRLHTQLLSLHWSQKTWGKWARWPCPACPKAVRGWCEGLSPGGAVSVPRCLTKSDCHDARMLRTTADIPGGQRLRGTDQHQPQSPRITLHPPFAASNGNGLIGVPFHQSRMSLALASAKWRCGRSGGALPVVPT
jgi:hypothetical protein